MLTDLVPDYLLGKVCIGTGVGVAIQGTGRFPELGDFNDQVPRYLVCLRGDLRTEEGGPGVRNDPNKWDLPGGAVDFGESLEAAVRREIREELGVWLQLIHHIGHYEDIREGEHWISHTHRAVISIASPAPVVPESERSKLVKLRFMTLEELENVPTTKGIVELRRILAAKTGTF
jgi:ADP-ribose pyrophosphatase YjhB (NUDIX family)